MIQCLHVFTTLPVMVPTVFSHSPLCQSNAALRRAHPARYLPRGAFTVLEPRAKADGWLRSQNQWVFLQPKCEKLAEMTLDDLRWPDLFKSFSRNISSQSATVAVATRVSPGPGENCVLGTQFPLPAMDLSRVFTCFPHVFHMFFIFQMFFRCFSRVFHVFFTCFTCPFPPFWFQFLRGYGFVWIYS